jgi:hypothetical protein
MSIKVMNLVWQFAPYRGNTLLTLLALADWANDEGLAWPKVETLAAKSRQSVRSTQYAIEELCRGEMLATIANPGRGNAKQYAINMQKLHLLQTDERVQFTTQKGAIYDTKGCKTRQRNKEEPSGTIKNHQEPSVLCRKCKNVGTYPHPGHPGMEVQCGCPAGQALDPRGR